jgi:hypothetical protein
MLTTKVDEEAVITFELLYYMMALYHRKDISLHSEGERKSHL